MASPYDSAIDMFNLPRFGVGASPFPRRADPMEDARRRFLEGGGAQPEPQDFVAQRAMEAADPFGVMQEVENLRREREEQGFISDIASLNPGGETYSSDLLGLIQKNPRIAQSKGALGLIDVQRQLAPKPKDYTTQFRDPVYRTTYQQKVKAGMDPDMAYEQTLSESANEEMAIDLIRAGIPAERHGELMTGGAFDRRKVAQAVTDASRNAPKKPWLDRLSDKESELVRTEVRDAIANAPDDFTAEFEAVKKQNPEITITEDEYVRKYKGDPDFKTYKLRRALESGVPEKLMREYGLTPQEVSGLFGISIPQGAPSLAPQAAPEPLPSPGAPQPPPGPQNAPQGALSSVMGYEIRQPFPGEDKYFRENPNVTGMAAEDGKITLNPYSNLSIQEKAAVAQNEALRLKMRESNYTPKFALTPEQERFFAGTPYAKDPAAAKQTVMARILSGDPSVGVTNEQYNEAQAFMASVAKNAPQAPPVPQEQPPAANAIPSYAHRLNPTPIDSIIKNVEQVAPAVGNVFSNITTDPLGKVGDLVLGRPAHEVFGEAFVAPSQERDNDKWNAAKASMMEYLNSLGKSPQEVEEMLGSILRGDRLPIAVFLKEGATKDDEGRLTASTALGQAFRRAKKTPAGSALTDSSGSHGWENVARALAQEYFTRKGVISPTNNSAPVATGPSSAPVPVSSLDDIRKLPIGASFTYKGQTRVKTSEVK